MARVCLIIVRIMKHRIGRVKSMTEQKTLFALTYSLEPITYIFTAHIPNPIKNYIRFLSFGTLGLGLKLVKTNLKFYYCLYKLVYNHSAAKTTKTTRCHLLLLALMREIYLGDSLSLSQS